MGSNLRSLAVLSSWGRERRLSSPCSSSQSTSKQKGSASRRKWLQLNRSGGCSADTGPAPARPHRGTVGTDTRRRAAGSPGLAVRPWIAERCCGSCNLRGTGTGCCPSAGPLKSKQQNDKIVPQPPCCLVLPQQVLSPQGPPLAPIPKHQRPTERGPEHQ